MEQVHRGTLCHMDLVEGQIAVTVLYFASLSDVMGGSEQTLQLPEGSSVNDLIEALELRAPKLRDFQRRFRVAQDQEFVSNDTPLRDGAELALIPPVSGGCGPDVHVEISGDPLSVDRALEFVRRRDCGAVVTFLGTVRDVTGSEVTERLDYTAYQTMAEKELGAICVEAVERFEPLGALFVAHRVGSLFPGDIAVVVAASSPHRAGAFDAARYLIDTTKARVPLWKKEVGPGGKAWVEGDARVPSNS